MPRKLLFAGKYCVCPRRNSGVRHRSTAVHSSLRGGMRAERPLRQRHALLRRSHVEARPEPHKQKHACRLISQASIARCKFGISFGCDNDSIWVVNCRGLFRCGEASVQCGYPPGAPFYRCHCNASRHVYLYGLSAAFSPESGRETLRSMPPMVLQPDGPARTLHLGPLYVRHILNRSVSLYPRLELCRSHGDASVQRGLVRNAASASKTRAQSRRDWQELRVLNPSIAPAPPGLCQRCAYVAAVRVDSLHQCPGSIFTQPRWIQRSQVDWFQHTAIVVLDEQLELLGWTWLINSPVDQVRPLGSVPPGAADVFAPPARKGVWDARLLAAEGGVLFLTYNCVGCLFRISELQITAGSVTTDPDPARPDRRPRLRLTRLQAWVLSSFSYPSEPWLQGRNQALFLSQAGGAGSRGLRVQPWFGLVGSFGALQTYTQAISCDDAREPQAAWDASGCQLKSTKACAATARYHCGAFLGQLRVTRARPGRVTLAHNHTDVPLTGPGDTRLSTSVNLIPVSLNSSCHALLGIGHLHRSQGKLAAPATRRRASRRAAQSRGRKLPPQPFLFGYYYTHFFYTLEPHSPYRLLSTSQEFCLSAVHVPSDCESVQFITGMALNVSAPRPQLVISYGTSDCESRFVGVRLDRIWEMLRPMPQARSVCSS